MAPMNISMSTVAAPSAGQCAFDFWGIVPTIGPAVPLRDFTSDGARLMVLGATPFCGPWFMHDRLMAELSMIEATTL